MLSRYDPPANLVDFDAIAGQREAWHRFVQSLFDSEIASLQKRLQAVPGHGAGVPQFYSATQLDPGCVVEQDIVWNAFPKELLRRFGRDKALVEADRRWPLPAYQLGWRFDPDLPLVDDAALRALEILSPRDVFYQPAEEYCEWHVDRCERTGRMRRVAFTSEPPEYWQALFGGQLPASATRFPGDPALVVALYQKLVDPRVTEADLRVKHAFHSPLGLLQVGDYNPYNKWNTTHGIVHLSAPPNVLAAEIDLAAQATLLVKDGRGELLTSADALIAGTGIGGANRNSDPTIAGSVNVQARLGRRVTLANPVGLYIDHIDLSGWETPRGIEAQECVRTTRGSGRSIARLEVAMPTSEFDLADIRIGGVPLVHGGQIAECITVKLTAAVCLASAITNRHFPSGTSAYVDPRGGSMTYVMNRRTSPTGTIRAFDDKGAGHRGAEGILQGGRR